MTIYRKYNKFKRTNIKKKLEFLVFFDIYKNIIISFYIKIKIKRNGGVLWKD